MRVSNLLCSHLHYRDGQERRFARLARREGLDQAASFDDIAATTSGCEGEHAI